jgi:hypothetical protein
MKSRLFFTTTYQTIQKETLDLLNSRQDFLSPDTLNSTRAAGDAVENILADSFALILGDLCSEYSASFARRAMADIAFTDVDGFYYVVDVKTHRIDTRFNMPNLTSVEQLARFYEDDSNYFVLLLVSYQLDGAKALFTDLKFVPIEFLSWDCLTIGALGWGQIQIANSNRIEIHPQYSRKKWMLELCDALMAFYPKEIGKITARIEHFEKVRHYWLTKPDD